MHPVSPSQLPSLDNISLSAAHMSMEMTASHVLISFVMHLFCGGCLPDPGRGVVLAPCNLPAPSCDLPRTERGNEQARSVR